MVPLHRQAQRSKALYFRRKIQVLALLHVMQRFYPKAIACCKDPLVTFVPQHKSKFPAQILKAARSITLIKSQHELAVRGRLKLVAPCCKLLVQALVIVNLPVDDGSYLLIRADEGLLPAFEVDDAKTVMPQSDR